MSDKPAKKIIHVATNDKADYETKELGEAYAMIAQVARHFQLAEQYLEWLRASKLDTVRKSAQTAFEILGDLKADSSWAALVSEAKDAATEARVVKMEVST